MFVAAHNRDFGSLSAMPYDADAHGLSSSGVGVAAPVDFFVVVVNTADKDVYIHEEWNSLGYDNLVLDMRILGKSENYHLIKKCGSWFKNSPTVIRVRPGSAIVYPVILDTNIWLNVPSIGIGAREYSCSQGAIFMGDDIEVKARLHVWFGHEDAKKLSLESKFEVISSWTSLPFRMKDVKFIKGVAARGR
ncbi:MAG: hypothetical protein WCO77_12590 [bacterium]